MKLVIAVVQDTDAESLLDALTAKGYPATQITSAGGFLREVNVTLLIGVDDPDIPVVVDIVERNSTARRKFVNPLMPFAPVVTSEDSSVRVGASVFIVNVSRFVRLAG
jgi:uncharacterized protein YaaQ